MPPQPISSAGGTPGRITSFSGDGGDFLQNLGSFGLSTLESIPELFGIEPTERTSEFRTQHPVLGVGSQLVGAFVPYLGAAKALRAAPITGELIEGASALGKARWSKMALEFGTETAMIEAARLGISATPLPSALYEGATGREAEVKPFSNLLGDAALNVAGAGVLGAGVGAVLGRVAKGIRPEDAVPGAHPDEPLGRQVMALRQAIDRAEDPLDPTTFQPETLDMLKQEYQRRMMMNLRDVEPLYGDNGKAMSVSQYKTDGGKNLFRPLEDESKSNPVTPFLNRVNKMSSNDGLTEVKKLVSDPASPHEFNTQGELDAVLDQLGVSQEALGTYAQDAKYIKVKEGVGKQPLPTDYASPLQWIRDKVGRIEDFYHGTNVDINDWTPGKRGGISFSSKPEFASDWASQKGGATSAAPGQTGGPRVYITAIKADPKRVGDFHKPADVLKAIEAANKDPSNPLNGSYKTGYWGVWEDLKMMHKAGWDTVYMVESPGAGGTLGAKNIFVTNGDHIYSAFDPKVMWAKNIRLHASEPVYNKPGTSSPLGGRANGLSRRFNSKAWKDVGDGWGIAVEQGRDGMYVMRKKVVGGQTPSAGDAYVVFRTAHPEVFTPRQALVQREVFRSGFLPIREKAPTINEPAFDALSAVRNTLDQNELVQKAAPKGKVGRFGADVGNTIGTYAAPTIHRATTNPLLNKGVRLIDEAVALANARVSDLMHGTHTLDAKKSIAGNIATLDKPKGEGLADFIHTLSKEDLQDILNLDEASLPFETIQELHGRGIISDNVHHFFTAGQAIADETVRRAEQLKDVASPDALKVLNSFKSRRAHYALTREYPGHWKYMLEDEAGNMIGQASGITPGDALDVANRTIEKELVRGRQVRIGPSFDESMQTPEDLERLKNAIARPGFIKARSNNIGYELSRGELTSKKLVDIVTRNVQIRENLFRDIALYEHTADIAQKLKRTKPQDAEFLEKRLKLLQGDEGAFGAAQNAIVDRTLNAVGLTGKNSASKIVQNAQKLLGAWTFGFGSIPQVLLNLTGVVQTLLPHIAYTLDASAERLARNYASIPMLDGQNNVKNVFGVLSPWKVMKNSMDLVFSNETPEDFRALFEEMVRRGKVAPRFAEEQMGSNGALLANPKEALRRGEGFIGLANAANQLLMSKSEEFNRAFTVAAAYTLGKEAGMDVGRLANFAQEMIAQVNYNYSTVDRATVFTTPLGSLAGTFKNWMFHYIGSMVKYAGAGKEGVQALMWQTAATAGIGGLAATPLILPIANGFSQFFSGNDFMSNLYDLTGNLGMNERVADGLMYGLPGAMGVSLSSQASAPGANPERDAEMLFSFAAFDRMKSLTAAAKDAIVNATTTGETPWDDQQVRTELMRAFAPRTLYRAMAVGQDGALRSMATGNPVMQNLGMGDHLLYAAGFSPTELEKTYNVYNKIKDQQATKRAMTVEFGQTLAQAWETDDDRLASRVFVRAMAVGVDTSSVLRSARARMQRQTDTSLNLTATPEDQDTYSFMFQ